jgi:hypothetical protein
MPGAEVWAANRKYTEEAAGGARGENKQKH